MADFTPDQGRYLAFLHAHIKLHGYPVWRNPRFEQGQRTMNG
jgi:hypothetical protein